MKSLPFEAFDIYTKLSSDEVFYRLRAIVDTKETWWIFITKPFFGKVRRDRFKIHRTVLDNRRSVLTFGEIHKTESGSRIHIQIRLPWLFFLFITCIFGYIYVAFFQWIMNLILLKIQTGIWQVESISESLLTLATYPIFMAIFYLLPLYGFNHEAYHIKTRLRQILDASSERIYQYQILGMTEIQLVKSILSAPIVISLAWMIYKLLL